MKFKTIFVPIYHGGKAKSFFHTDIYAELTKVPNIRMIIAIPSVKLDFYRKEYPESTVIFEPYDLGFEPRLGRILNRVAFNLLPTSTVRGKQKLYYRRYGGFLKFFFARLANYTLGPMPFVKSVIRYFDGFVPLDEGAVRLLEKYKPDLVIAPDIVFATDRIFLRAAKRMGQRVIGMARSWDNLTSKGFIQVLPDKLVVYTNQMISEAVKYVGMLKEDVFMGGPPQFDIYFKDYGITREKFLGKFGIDPSKKIILCAPFFDRYTGSAVVMINELTDAIENGALPKNTHLLVRYRPGTPPILERLLKKSPHVTITEPCVVTFDGKDRLSPTEDFEWTRADIELLVHSLKFSDVIINTVSTLSVDAAVYDKPVINVRFDADPNTPPHHSVMVMLPDHDHYKAIEKTGGVKLVGSMMEMIEAINAYLKNPKLDFDGRERLRREQIVFMDGLAGKRIADFIKRELA